MRHGLKSIDSDLNQLLASDPFLTVVEPAYLREAVAAYPARGGKRLRPALTLWCCGLVGGDSARARRAALAVELYHNWTLIHDDIIDNDDTRRGEPSCHKLLAEVATAQLGLHAAAARFGTDMSMLAGDILHGWSLHMLARSTEDGVPAEVAGALVSRLCGWVTPALISGEALDVEFEYRWDVQPAEVEKMLRLKTGVLLRFAAEAGAAIGLGTCDLRSDAVRALGEFAESAGLAFQLRDDVLGLFGDAAQVGKPIGSDVRAGKRTLLCVEALARAGSADRERLLAVLGDNGCTDRDVEEVRELVCRCGARDAVERRAADLIASARGVLGTFPAGSYRDLLAQWTDFMVSRHH